MSFAGLSPPTIGGFLNFIRQTMGITTGQLPDNSFVIPIAFGVSMDIVNPDLAGVSSDIYTLAVYNLAGSQLLMYAPDQTGQTFFKDARKEWNLLDFLPGIISSSGDQGTNQSYINPEWATTLTLQNLQNLKDPYGRQYLQFAQAIGPNAWGIS